MNWFLIQQVRQVLAGRPDEAAEIAGRLKEELQQLLADRKAGRSSWVSLPSGSCRWNRRLS